METTPKCFRYSCDRWFCCSQAVADVAHMVGKRVYCSKCCPVHGAQTPAVLNAKVGKAVTKNG